MHRLCVLCGLCGFLLPACAPHRLSLPAGPGIPFDQFEQAFQDATASCRAVHTLTAELRLGGRAGRERLRGRLLAGLAEPASMRLEALAPFGPPAFILVGSADRATLLLPKDDLVLRNERPAGVLNALAGLALEPDDLRVALTGCATTAAAARSGRSYQGGWVALDANRATLYVKKVEGRWRTLAAQKGDWRVEYGEWLNGIPRRVRFSTGPQASSAGVTIDLEVEVIDLQTNVTLDARTFELDVPASARPLTLDELRRLGPLGADRGRTR